MFISGPDKDVLLIKNGQNWLDATEVYKNVYQEILKLDDNTIITGYYTQPTDLFYILGIVKSGKDCAICVCEEFVKHFDRTKYGVEFMEQNTFWVSKFSKIKGKK